MTLRVWLLDLQIMLHRIARRLLRAAGWRQRPRLRRMRVGRSELVYDTHAANFLLAYQDACLDLLRCSLQRTAAPLQVLLGELDGAAVPLHPDLQRLRVGFQYEHTLVRAGGRDSAGASLGAIAVPGGSAGERYLVRLADQPRLAGCDLVIEYSQPNVVNLRSSAGFDAHLARTVLIAPILGAPLFELAGRDRELLSVFADPAQSRRHRLLADARRAGLPLRNIQGVFDLAGLRRLYRQTRILVNVHQTDHHHTFEELRVLPALLCGVIVVSETVPLREHIACSDFIIWADYPQLCQTLAEVRRDYQQHWQRIFGDPRLPRILAELAQDNQRAMDAGLQRAVRPTAGAPAETGP